MKLRSNIRFVLIFSILSLTTCLHNISAQTTVKHQTGIYYPDFLIRGTKETQKTHEYRTTIYTNSTTTTLTLPSTGNSSPSTYFRWYDYKTDGASARLSYPDASGTTSAYTNGRVAYGGTNYIEKATYTMSGTVASFTYDSIACDVAANKDYVLSGSTFTEPTLSYRCIYNIRPAREIATQLKDLVATGKFLEEHVVYMPKSPASMRTGTNPSSLPRVTLKYDPTNYFGYNSNNQLEQGAGSKIVASGVGVTSTLNGRFIFINPKDANISGNSTVVEVKMTVGSLNTGTGVDTRKTYNIAKFTVYFVDDKPMPYTDLNTTALEKRKTDYLDKNYVLLSKLDFDYNTDLPSVANNMWPNPLPWDICSYGFVSKKMYEDGKRGFPTSESRVGKWNEYGFYKTANVANISNSSVTGYTWYNSGRTVYDRLYDSSNKTKAGYFMYIDAATTPGIVAKLPIDRLCPGTKLIVSAAIASLTESGGNATSYPDLNFVFLGLKANGEEVELNRYTSGDIPSATGSPTPWFQMYYTFDFNNNNVDYVSYKLQVENNCTSTSGGDYAVDDIRVYRSKPTVQANQITLPCGSTAAKVKVRVEYEKLLQTMGVNEVTAGGNLFEVKYKFLDEDKNPINYTYGTSFDFGRIKISSNFSAMPAPSDFPDGAPIATGATDVVACREVETIDGIEYRYIVFQTPNNQELKMNKKYHTVVSNTDNFPTDICSLISDPFVIMPPFNITVDGASWVEGEGMCYGNTIILGANLKDRLTHENISCLFDWYIGTQEEYETAIAGGMSAEDALSLYREEYPKPISENNLMAVKGYFTQTAYNVLEKLIEDQKLVLNKEKITRIIRFGEAILAIPIVKTAVSSTPSNLSLCTDYIPIRAGEPHKNPSITWNPSGESLYLRMGLTQFNNLKSNLSKTLTVPVRDFKNADQTRLRNLKLANNVSVYLISTDDPAYDLNPLVPSLEVAKISNINVTEITTDEDNVVFNNWKTLNVKEGYTYQMEFHFNQVYMNGDIAACDGTATFSIKIVPEYLTWTGAAGDNWNNDANWIRSTQAELYKDMAGQNSDSYSDYSSPLERKGFVPLDFTKVTIHKDAPVMPWLYKLEGSPYLDMANTNYTDIADMADNAATQNIEYDLIVKANGSNYDCKNFVGNICDQIYFKSLAEMRNTNFLVYNKAHVDFELVSGRWYILSSPLKGVVAGDMYLPTTGGQQKTEAFRPITFNTTLHNRFNPPVFQRSWDRLDSYIFRYGGSFFDSYIASNWSHVYNKVNEVYTPATGFSVKAVYGTEGVDKVLFRLPKDDTKYLYYTYNGASSGNETNITRTNNGKLVFDSPSTTNVVANISNQSSGNNIFLVGNPFMATLDMNKFFNGNPDFQRKYWHFTTNGISAVQIDLSGNIFPSGNDVLSGTIVPMQGFFIERNSSANTANVSFTPSMTTTPTGSTLRSVASIEDAHSRSDFSFRVKATRKNITGSALIHYKTNSSNSYIPEEDMLAIMDSNLDDIPLVYSMADNQALLINTLNKADSILLGIYSNDETENVKISFEGIGSLSEMNLRFYDKLKDKEYVIKSEKDSIVVSGNSHGRYSVIMSNKIDDIHEKDEAIHIYSVGKGKVEVQLLGRGKMQNVKVYTLSGVLVKNINPSKNIINLTLNSDQVYVFYIKTDHSTYSKKLYCK